jgi:hypothetical protein
MLHRFLDPAAFCGGELGGCASRLARFIPSLQGGEFSEPAQYGFGDSIAKRRAPSATGVKFQYSEAEVSRIC